MLRYIKILNWTNFESAKVWRRGCRADKEKTFLHPTCEKIEDTSTRWTSKKASKEFFIQYIFSLRGTSDIMHWNILYENRLGYYTLLK